MTIAFELFFIVIVLLGILEAGLVVSAVGHFVTRVIMAKLDAKERNSMPSEDFGLPAQRKFPLENRSHAANAKSRASQMLKAGHISKAEYEKICAKADRKLGK